MRAVYLDEEVANVGLEEIKLDASEVWRITIGFSRPWDSPRGFVAAQLRPPPSRSYKVVNIDDESGDVVSMDARDVTQAAQ